MWLTPRHGNGFSQYGLDEFEQIENYEKKWKKWKKIMDVVIDLVVDGEKIFWNWVR